MTGRAQSGSRRARRGVLVVGGTVSAFVAAAAMATGSAAPARADFEDLLDPIIQPILTSLTDSLTTIDPSLALDLTSWSDSLLTSLDPSAAAASVSDAVAAASSTAEAASSSTSATYDLPITIQEATEPTVAATVNGSDTTLLVDTGSSGLVVPLTDLDGGSTNFFTELESLSSLGTPVSFGESGYSGGVDYLYLTYDNVSVDYADGLTTTTPVEVEVYSWDPSSFSSLFSNDAYQDFLQDNDVTGILGIGDATSGGAGTSPLEAAGFNYATVDLPAKELIVSNTAPSDLGTAYTASGSNIDAYETVTTNGTTTGSTVSDDLDSGGVYGTIPSSLYSDVEPGSTITVYSSEGGPELYSYTVGTDSIGQSTAPDEASGTSIDSGVIPFEQFPVTIDYGNDTLYLDN